MKGIFSSQILIDNQIVSQYTAPNKIVSGSRRLVTDLLSTKFLSLDSGIDIGLNSFVLYDIADSESCVSQAILGSFDAYDDFDPIYETEINSTNFPCLTGDSIVVTDITSDNSEEPLDDESLIYATIEDNQIHISVKIGKGFVELSNRKFSMAALIGKSSDSSKANMVYAIEQFPLMIKTQVAFFKFNWTCFI